MSPTVLNIAYPFAAVSADPVGGAEQVLARMDQALVARGWRSIVVAPEGSSVAGELVTVPAVRGQIEDQDRAATHAAVQATIAYVITREKPDLIHLHGVDFHAYLPPPGPPVLATLHLPLDWYPREALRPARPLTWLNPVSPSQAAGAPADVALTRPIENGVDVAAFSRAYVKRGYVAALGRICPEKGFHLALDAAKAAGVPMLLAGEVFAYAAHQQYFETEIAPRLDQARRWIGPVKGAAKRRLLGAARCVLIPSLVPETSSLVAREALAAGTPVVALARGALPETVEHGRTGFLVGDEAAMAAAIPLCDSIDPATCRATARERFALSRMTEGYLALYEELLTYSRSVSLPPQPSPFTGEGRVGVKRSAGVVKHGLGR